MTSTFRGEGRTEADACEWRGFSSLYTSTQKIRIHRRHSVLFSCKEVRVFKTRISFLDGIKSGTFRRY